MNYLPELPDYLQEVALLVSEGYTNREIALRLQKPVSTIAEYVKRTAKLIKGVGSARRRINARYREIREKVA